MTYIASYHGFLVDGNTPSTNDEVYFNPKETKTVRVKLRNDGSSTWSKTGSNPVRLGAVVDPSVTPPTNRSSGFADNGAGGLNTGWLDVSGYPKSRIEMVESSVTPGNFAHFEADFRGTPEASNFYAEKFRPLAEGLTWMNNPNIYIVCDLRPIATTAFPWHVSNTPTDGYRWGDEPNVPSNRTTDIPKLSGGTEVDIPDGFHSFLDVDTCYRHVELMKECGFNLIALSWGGHGTVEDYGCDNIINVIRNNSEFENMKYCFFVAVKQSSGFPFNYLHDFTSDGFYAKWDGKPLLPTFGTAQQSDSRFNMPSMGAFSSSGMTWLWETAWPIYGEHPVKGSAGTIIPRYDDRKTGEMPYGRPTTQHYNKDLAGTMYADQFNAVKTAWNNRTIRTAWINSWNETHERIGPIFPHEDISVEGPTVDRNSNVDNDNYLFDITKGYIEELKA